tara:strand:+ start:1739 stop:2329 length:591 start_codon:yes stop_codon:yes gene_type:complete
MGRLFVTNREIDLISDITSEIFKDVIGQAVYYYPISEEKTKLNDIYNESSQKIFDTPIEIRALVEYNGEAEVTTTKYGQDHVWNLTVFFHKKDMVNKSITLRDGDFLQYGGRFFEIQKLTMPKDIYGQNENITEIRADCRIARETQFRTKKESEPTEFTQYRGLAGTNSSHDKRALQDGNDPKIVVLGDANTVPIK